MLNIVAAIVMCLCNLSAVIILIVAIATVSSQPYSCLQSAYIVTSVQWESQQAKVRPSSTEFCSLNTVGSGLGPDRLCEVAEARLTTKTTVIYSR